MAKKVKVSVYGMNISRNGVDRVNLNNIFQGRSLIQIVNEYIEQKEIKLWHYHKTARTQTASQK